MRKFERRLYGKHVFRPNMYPEERRALRRLRAETGIPSHPSRILMNPAVILTAVLAAACCAPLRAADSTDPLASEIKRFIDAYAILESMGADPVNSEQAFYQGAIPGLLRKLDPHSVFFDPG